MTRDGTSTVPNASTRRAADSRDHSGDPDLRAGINVIRHSPLNGETPAHALLAPVTPTANAYVRTNFDVPALDAETHRIRIEGAVSKPFDLSVAAMDGLEQRTVLVTMECAGNDRTAIIPPVDGEPWTGGALSTVHWSGVSLRSVLDRAKCDPRAIAVLFEGADQGHVASVGGVVTFARSLPLSDAMHPDTLLATAMNGEPIPPRYGAPVRLVVPGWFGMASVKWLRRIEVLTAPFEGYFQTKRYIYDDGHQATPVTRMRVKSMIADPVDGGTVSGGRVRITGWAWSGDGQISAVDVGIDDGPGWHAARLHPPESPTAWTAWDVELELCAGTRILRSRARDSAGNVQPEGPVWNVLGYGNNGIRRTRVEVAARAGG